MDVWSQSFSGKKRFQYGKESYLLAAEAALRCALFVCDDEDEMVCDEERSCYNCRRRRWTVNSFECMKP